MKIYVISDIHLEMFSEQLFSYKLLPQFNIFNEDDVLILNGDICNVKIQLEKILTYLKNKIKKVIFITGNHEYYGSSIKSINKYLENLENKYEFFIHLNRKTIEIDNILICGATGWPNVNNVNISSLNDFKYIDGFNESKCIELYNLDYNFFSSWSNLKNYKKVIFTTHFLPSLALVAEHHRDSLLNNYFCNGYYDININLNPNYWIYGHDHNKFNNIHLNNTIFLSNQGEYGKKYLDFKFINI